MSKISNHFNREEFACKCKCGFNTVDAELINVLEDLRKHFNRPVRINSGCRCDEYNKKVGGANNSQHKVCRAADVTVDDISPIGVWNYLNNKYHGKYGMGRYVSFTHIDTRNNQARW